MYMFTFDFGVKYGQIIQHVLVCGIQCVCKCWTGVWGSAFSILFNRILGFNDVPNGSTMEEELGMITSFFYRSKNSFTLPFYTLF